MSEKRFAPTAARLQRARADGDTARASELAAQASLAASLVALLPAISRIGDAVREMLLAVLRTASSHPPQRAALAALPYAADAARACAGVLLAGLAAGAATTLFATRGALVPLRIKPARLSPMPALARLFSAATPLGIARAAVALTLAVALAAPPIVRIALAAGAQRSPLAVAALVFDEMRSLGAALLALGVCAAAIEVGAGIMQRRKKLCMSFEELRREHREQTGDPHVRGRRRRRHRAASRGGSAAVRKAVAVVVNPTHIAVALHYDPPAVSVPLAAAIGVDEAAARMREIANDAGVPIIEDVPLARLLFARCEEGDPIPVESYAAVAVIIAAVQAEEAR